MPVAAVDLVFHSIVVGSLNGPRKINRTHQRRTERRFADGHRHSCETNDADVDDRCFTALGQGPGVNERVRLVGVRPIVVHRDVEVPVFHRAVSAQPVGEFSAVAILVKLFKLNLDLNVIVVVDIGGSLNRQRVAGQVKGLVDRSGHRNIVPEAVVVGWRIDDDTTVVLQRRAGSVEHLVECTRSIHQTETPLVVPSVGNVGLGGRASGLRRIAKDVANLFG